MNSRLEWRLPLPEEDRYIFAFHGSNPFVGVKPSNLKAQHIPVMLLCAFDINDRQLRHRVADRFHFFVCAHKALLVALYSISPTTRQISTLPSPAQQRRGWRALSFGPRRLYFPPISSSPCH